MLIAINMDSHKIFKTRTSRTDIILIRNFVERLVILSMFAITNIVILLARNFITRTPIFTMLLRTTSHKAKNRKMEKIETTCA